MKYRWFDYLYLDFFSRFLFEDRYKRWRNASVISSADVKRWIEILWKYQNWSEK